MSKGIKALFLLYIITISIVLVSSFLFAEGQSQPQAPAKTEDSASLQDQNPAQGQTQDQVQTQSTEEAQIKKAQPVEANQERDPFKSLLEEEQNKKNVKKEPLVIQGDKIEFSTDKREVIITGNAQVDYKGTKLTCDKLMVNMQEKSGVAQGHARLDEKEGVIEGEKLSYNFETKTGIIFDAAFRSNPYFGRAKRVDKIADTEFIAKKGYVTTCGMDHPHYRIATKKVNFFPKEKIQTEGDSVYAGSVPIIYMPQYNHSLKDPLMHVQVTPGKSKDWGAYLLTGWRYNLTQHLNGRVNFDYRSNLGLAEGFGANYDTPLAGKGDFKFYYTHESLKDYPEDSPHLFQRYLIRLRHKWDIDERTNLTSEIFRIVDSKRMVLGSDYSILKDYFYREYEKQAQPPSYVLIHHAFDYSSLDLFIQKRTNRWYDPGYLESLPEARFNMPAYPIGNLPIYIEDYTTAGNYNKKNTSTSTPALNNTSATTTDVHDNRLDTTNKFSYPMKVAFIQLTPFVSDRTTFYSEDVNGDKIAPRTIFYSGADMSTKFFRVFNINTNFMGLDLNGLRHIITPTVGYAYNHIPSISNTRLKQIDGVDSIDMSNKATLNLSNKLQTKRKNKSVDLVDFLVTSQYIFKPKTTDERGSQISDILFKLKILPYSWMSINADATYKHSGDHSDPNYNRFTDVNYDFNLSFGQERTFAFGQRYLRKGGNELTTDLDWRINPKWKFSIYQRRNIGHDPTLKRGLREQEYTISRDLHCWAMDITYNIKRGQGETIWLIMRLKAFPEMEFEYNQSYHAPKPGSQSNP